MPIATMTSKGQVTIPASVRDAYGLVSGTRLEFVAVDNDTFVIHTRVPALADLYRSLPSNGVHLALEQMDDAIAHAVAETEEQG